MLRVIIESPYAAPTPSEVSVHVTYARDCLEDSVVKRREAGFASHLLYTQILDDKLPDERHLGIQAGYEWMANADIVAFYIDWGWSPGMIKAAKVARLLGRRLEVRSLFNRPTGEPPQ